MLDSVETYLVHYWLNGMRGGEKVLEACIDVLPKTHIITNVYIERNISNKLANKKITTTFINKLPFIESFYQYYLPLYPKALKMININSKKLVISSESGPAKGITVARNIPHICYTHSPMRYIWDMQDEYFGTGFKRIIFQPIINYLQKWDYTTAQKVDYVVANSNFVKQRIKKYWNRKAEVIHPPVDTKKFSISNNIEEYYLLFGQHVKYKKSELAIRAFNNNRKKLIVMGGGEELPFLRSIAKDNISILGKVNEDVMKKYLASCRALIFPGIEDFGIIPVEAMACGRPVIAYNIGGATETVSENITGLFFNEQTVTSLNSAIDKFENIEDNFNSLSIINHAQTFDVEIFKEKFKEFVKYCLDDFHKTGFSNRR